MTSKQEISEMLIATFTNLAIHGAIYSLDGAHWASTAGFGMSADEARALASRFTTESDPSDVVIAGTKYPAPDAEHWDKVSFSGQGDAGMYSVRKTQGGLVVGCWTERYSLAWGAGKVDNAADYLMNEGY